MKKIVSNIYNVCYQSDATTSRERIAAVALMVALHASALIFLSCYL